MSTSLSALSLPFELGLHPKHRAARLAWRAVKPFLERGLGLTVLAELFERLCTETDAHRFIERVLESLKISLDASDLDVARIPTDGPCIVVANHPFGAAEGLCLSSLLRSRRGDVRMMANSLLGRIPSLREHFVLVNPFGDRHVALSNARALRECVTHLKKGGMLAMFPAGEVASFRARRGRVIEAPWSCALAVIARRSGAPVLPVHFAGSNSRLFHAAGLVHPRFRTALLVREFLNKSGRRLDVRVGSLIHPKRLAACSADAELVAYVRERVEVLSERPRRREVSGAAGAAFFSKYVKRVAIAAPQNPHNVREDIERLPECQRLFSNGDTVVSWARAAQIPNALVELGRLREITFRAAGEGTGKPLDVDGYDSWYVHLIAYDQRAREIVGAYRLGPTDEILPTRGRTGLYTSSLFRMAPELFERLGPALEMGRSFVRDSYQKSAAGLYALWRGIGAFVARNPRYRFLFGPVSISNSFAPRSRELIVQFLQAQNHMHPWGHLVRARQPFASRAPASFDNGVSLASLSRDIDDVSGAVGDIEPDRKGVPALLRQYMRLGGKMLGFNIDVKFGRALDGLILVDLLEAERRMIDRYLGTEQAAAFRDWHGRDRRLVG